MRTIQLNKAKAFELGLIQDIKEYFQKYQVIKETCLGIENAVQPYRLEKGAPALIKIDCLYIRVEDLDKVCQDKDRDAVKAFVKEWETHAEDKEVIEWEWN